MIFVINGDNLEESRYYYQDIKKNLKEPVFFEGESLSSVNLIEFFNSKNLFHDSRDLIIENLLSKKKFSKELEEIVSIMNKNENSSDIVLWEEKEVGKKMLGLFSKAKVSLFKYPQIIFNFLDSIKPGNGKNLIFLFHKLIEQTPIELIIYMFVRQIRILIAISDRSDIDEVKTMAPWIKSKYQKQAFLFTREYLTKLYREIFMVDLSIKTGKVNSATAAIDFLLLDI